LEFLRRNPDPFVSLASELWPGQGRHHPTLTHSFLALLADKDRLLRNYSQNIDGLEYLARMPEQRLVECHGHFRTASCISCGKQNDIAEVKATIVERKVAPSCRYCKHRSNYVKPDIVFFGEGLPGRFHDLLRGDVADADLCLVLGTSLQVAPVSMIPEMVDCRRVLLNREHVGGIGRKNPTKALLDSKSRDLFCPGDCDESIGRIACVLGWQDELREKHKRTRQSDAVDAVRPETGEDG